MKKIVALKEAIQLIPGGAQLALGGNALNRAPMAAVFELIRQRKRDLRLVKTAGGPDVDLLCLAEAVACVDAGFISYETRYGLAQNYRRAVQSGSVRANEHACYTVISALRAASYGIPFMPVRGLQTTDLRAANDYFADVTDPFSGERLAAVKAIRPDFAIVHAQLADEHGNAMFEGPKYEDALMARASKATIVTAERIVSDSYFNNADRKADIPHFLVSAVVHAPRGAAPGACFDHYEPDGAALERLMRLSGADALREALEGRSFL